MTQVCTNQIMEAALDYARMDWPVFPCHPTGHQPLDTRRDEQGRSGFYLATMDAQQIENWWTRWPDAAIGLRTGEPSGVIVMDIDPRHGGDTFLEELECDHGTLPDTVESQTGGGGRHLFFRWPGQTIGCSVGAIASGIDIKADGGYVILPPSDHQSGNTYQWLIDQEPCGLESCGIADAPDWLIKRLLQQDSPDKATSPTTIDDRIPQGCRNKTLASMAGHHRQIGMGYEEIKAALLASNAHRCAPALEVREVEQIARSVCRYSPDTSRQALIEHWPDRYLANGKDASETTIGPITICMADVQSRDVDWLWPKRIALGKLTMLAGDPGLGKSFCSMDIAARVSAGLPWPDLPNTSQPKGDVIILSAEDALDDTIRPRLDAAGADPSRIIAVEAVRDLDPNTRTLRRRGFNLDRDIDNLGMVLKQHPNCRMVVIDPISAYMGEANSHNNAEVRALLAPLSDLAAQYRVAILAISHLNKGQGEAIYRVMGSLAFVAAARAGYAVMKDAKDTTGQRRLILPIKNNLGDDKTGLAYSIAEIPGHTQPHVEWEPDVIYATANDAANGEVDDERYAESRDQKKSQTVEAVDWIRSCLEHGPEPARKVIDAAKKDGISQRTLERAKVQANVVARRDHGKWMWHLVDIDALVQSASQCANA